MDYARLDQIYVAAVLAGWPPRQAFDAAMQMYMYGIDPVEAARLFAASEVECSEELQGLRCRSQRRSPRCGPGRAPLAEEPIGPHNLAATEMEATGGTGRLESC
jgi:hypothetical protein